MTKTRFLTAAVLGAAFISHQWSASVVAEGPVDTRLSAAEFEKLHKELQPPTDELWRTIPWHVSIIEARDAAAKAGKPIFVWVASGEPLGCG
jgi:hypothetical protein